MINLFGVRLPRFGVPKLAMTNTVGDKHGGFGLVEMIVAIGLWIVLISSGLVTLLGGLQTNRLADETSVASSIATEGLDAVKAIKKQGWTTPFLATNCVAGCGLAEVSGTWAYAGTNNVIGKYTRVVELSPVSRDGLGNIVATGGTVDDDTYLAKSTVNWSPGGIRNNIVTVYTYLTNYAKAIAVTLTGGIVIYGDGTTTPKYRTYDRTANSFSAEASGVLGAAGRTFQIRTSPTKTEAISGYTTTTGVLQIMCFNGTTWSNDWSVTVGGTSTTRRFDIAYETNSGDAMVLYSTNVGTTNEMAYRTKPGNTGCGAANWSTATNLDPTGTSGTVLWVKMSSDRRATSNLIVAAWSDNSTFPKLSAGIWSGSTWSLTPTVLTTSTTVATSLEYITAVGDVDSFDVEYESVSGDVMIMYSLGVNTNQNGVRYVTCTGGTAACSWSGVLTPPTLSDDATTMDVSANPNTDEIQFASIGNAQSDLQRCYWSGTAFTCAANVDTSSQVPIAGGKSVATGWLTNGATKRSIIIYRDSGATNIGWYACTTSTCTLQTDFTVSPVFGATQGWYNVEMDPINKEQLILNVSATTGNLFAKRLLMSAVAAYTWTNADGSAALETTMPQLISSPYSFAYWKQ